MLVFFNDLVIMPSEVEFVRNLIIFDRIVTNYAGLEVVKTTVYMVRTSKTMPSHPIRSCVKSSF